MLLSTQTDLLGRRHGDEEALRLLKKAGFDAYDFSFFRMFSQQEEYWANLPDFRETAKKLRAAADACGIVCNQAHAPFASSSGDPADDKRRFDAIVRSMEAAAILGAENIIVHPVKHLPYPTHREELKELNIEFYRSLVPYCEQFGIHVACENMWERNPANHKIINSVCSSPAEFCRYLDDIGSPWIVGCLDVGHTSLTDEDLGYFIRSMGSSRLKALHVHDTSLVEDSHTLPFTLRIDFQVLLDGLAAIGYEGDFTFEADVFLGKMPAALEEDAAAFMAKVGRYCISEIEKRRA